MEIFEPANGVVADRSALQLRGEYWSERVAGPAF